MNQTLISKLIENGYEQNGDNVFEKTVNVERVRTVMYNNYVHNKPYLEKIRFEFTLLGSGGEMKGDDIIKPYEFINIKVYSNGLEQGDDSIGLPEEDINEFEIFIGRVEKMFIH